MIVKFFTHNSILRTLGTLTTCVLLTGCVGPFRDSTNAWFIDASDFPPEICDSQPSEDDSLKCDRSEKDVIAGDVNNDGTIDFIVARKRYLSQRDCAFNHDPEACAAGLSNTTSNVNKRSARLILNEAGALRDRTADFTNWLSSSEHMTSRDVALADFNNDGYLDVVFAPTASELPRIYLNRGINPASSVWRGFSTTAIVPAIPSRVGEFSKLFCAVTTGDIDGDGDTDIFLSNYRPGLGTADVLLTNQFNDLGTGSVRFNDESIARLGERRNSAFGTASRIIDIDGDGDQDIVKISTLYNVAPWNRNTTAVLFNNGSGMFNSFYALPDREQYMFDIGYYNADNCLDIYEVTDGNDYLSLGRMTDSGMVFDTAIQLDRPSLVTSVGTGNRSDGLGGNIKHVTRDNTYLSNSIERCTNRNIEMPTAMIERNKIAAIIGVAPIDVEFPQTSCSRTASTRPAADMVLFRNLTDNDMWRDALGTGEALLVGVAGPGGTPEDTDGREVWEDLAHDFEIVDINRDGRLDIFMPLCTGYKVLEGVRLDFSASD